MANRWQYGNYQFDINPSSFSMDTKLVGDELRTLTGALVSQPSFLQDKYTASTTFYQPRTRVKGLTSFQNGVSIDCYNQKTYVLNKVNDRIDIYNQNYVFQSSLPLSVITTNKAYLWISVNSTGIYIASQRTSPAGLFVHSLNLTGSFLSTLTLASSSTLTGFTNFGGYHWILSNNGNIYKIRPSDGASIITYALPYGLYYEGISNDTDFLIVGNKDTFIKVYHVDSTSGRIVNQFSDDTITTFNDIAYNGTQYLAINNTSFSLQIILANTVEAEIYKFKTEMSSKKFVDMIDHLGIIRRVYISSLSIDRSSTSQYMYQVTMSITKVDRG